MNTLVLAAALLSSTPTYASDWVWVGGTTDGYTVAMDRSTLRVVGTGANTRVRAWLKWAQGAPTPVPGSYPAKTFLSEKSYIRVDCAERTLGTIAYDKFAGPDTTGEIVAARSVKEAEVVQEATSPDSIGEAIITQVCAAVGRK